MAQANTNKKPFRIAVAGLTHGHAGTILSRAHDGDFEIVGIAEADRKLAEQYLTRYKLPFTLIYPSLDAMLDKVKPDGVAAFNSTYEHVEVVKACAPRKIPVMVEKPLATSPEHAQLIESLAKANGILVLTNYETTWYGSNNTIRDLVITQTQLGPLKRFVIHDGHQGPKEIGCGPEFLNWLTDPIKNGAGALTDFGCYGANQVTWLLNGQRPISVTAVTRQYKPAIYPKVDDDATIIVNYPNAQAIIQASWNWPFGRKDMEIYGDKGYLIADRQGSRVKTGEKTPETYIPSPVLEKPQHDPFAYFAAVVRGEVKMAPYDAASLENNLIVVDILEHAKISAQQGKTITLNR
jgi:predicted dehydrogenase